MKCDVCIFKKKCDEDFSYCRKEKAHRWFNTVIGLLALFMAFEALILKGVIYAVVMMQLR